jgi:hypothetical protein
VAEGRVRVVRGRTNYWGEDRGEVSIWCLSFQLSEFQLLLFSPLHAKRETELPISAFCFPNFCFSPAFQLFSFCLRGGGARNAVLIGRPYLYGLAVSGAEGVAKVVNILREEFQMALALTGRPDIQSIDRSVLWT